MHFQYHMEIISLQKLDLAEETAKQINKCKIASLSLKLSVWALIFCFWCYKWVALTQQYAELVTNY